MNNLPRQKLIEIIRRHGREIITEPRRCEGLMRDNFPAHRREIAILTAALEERIPAELLASGKSLMPREALLGRLAARLHDDVAMEASAARWTVHTWALALGVITAGELDALEQTDEPADKRAASGPQPQAKTGQPPPQARTRQPPPRPQPANAAPAPPPDSQARAASPARASYIVALDGSGDFLTLTDAIARSPAGTRLLVRPGIYHEGLLIDKSLEIVGDGALEEIIVRATSSSCLLMRTDEATVSNLTFRGQALGSGIASEGFFAVDIPRGRLLLEGCDISSDSLACVALHNPAAAPLIRDCLIHHGADSGVFAFDGAQGVIEACDIFENANVAVAITNSATTSVRNCHIHHGGDAGIVVWNRAASTIEGCDVYANRRADVGISDGGLATLRNCRIHDGENTGVFTHRDGRALLEACNIYRHAAPEVAVESGGEVKLSNCQLHDGQSHGVFVHDGGRALLEACDVFSNLESGVHVDANGRATARACNINDNGHVGISCKAGSVVEAVGCDLTQNRVAAWETNHGSQVVSRNNRLQ